MPERCTRDLREMYFLPAREEHTPLLVFYDGADGERHVLVAEGGLQREGSPLHLQDGIHRRDGKRH